MPSSTRSPGGSVSTSSATRSAPALVRCTRPRAQNRASPGCSAIVREDAERAQLLRTRYYSAQLVGDPCPHRHAWLMTSGFSRSGRTSRRCRSGRRPRLRLVGHSARAPVAVVGGRLLTRGQSTWSSVRRRSAPLLGHQIAHCALGSYERRNAWRLGSKRRSGRAVGDKAIECACLRYPVDVIGRGCLPGGTPEVPVATQTISELSDLSSHSEHDCATGRADPTSYRLRDIQII